MTLEEMRKKAQSNYNQNLYGPPKQSTASDRTNVSSEATDDSDLAARRAAAQANYQPQYSTPSPTSSRASADARRALFEAEQQEKYLKGTASKFWSKSAAGTASRSTGDTPNATELNRRYLVMSKQATILEGLSRSGKTASDRSYEQHLQQFQKAYTDFEDYQKKYQDYTSEETTRKRREETQRQLDQQLEAQRTGQQLTRFANYIPQEYRQQMREQGAQADQQEIDRLRRQLEQDDEILAGYQQQRENDRLLGLDLETVKTQIDEKTAHQNELWQNYLSGTHGISWGATRESLNPDLAREIEDLQTEYDKAQNLQWRRDQGNQYQALANQPDFASNSQYIQSNDPETMLSQLRQQESELIYRISNDPSAPASLSTQLQDVQQQIRNYQALQEQVGSTYHDMTGENDSAQRFQYATDQERGVYYYLVNTGRYQEAADYADYLDYNLNERRQAQRVENAREFARNHPVLSTLASVPQSLASGVGQLDLMVQKMENAGSGKPVDFNTSWQDPYYSANTTRGTIAQDLNEKYGTLDESIPVIGGMGAGNLYQVGTSMLDSAAVLALTSATGLPPLVGTSLLGGAAATAASQDAHNRGLSDSQAIATGLMAGIWETMFEYVSIDNLLKPSMSAGSLRSALGAAAKQAGIEASEEFLTTAANTLSDLAINGDQSQLMGDYQRYLAQGDSASRAAAKTFGGALNTALQDALAGAISGGVMGGGKAAVVTMLPTRTTSTQTQTRPAVEQTQALAHQMETEAASTRAAEGQQGQGAEPLSTAPQQAQGGQQVETLPMADTTTQGQQATTLPMREQTAPRQVTTLPMREQESSGLYTTSIDTDPSTHTPEENARIQEYTRSTDSKIVSFINRVLGLKNRNFRNKVNLEFAPVSDRAAADILSMTGVDASGFTHELTGRAVDHIIERHGSEGEADSSMRDVNDIARIGYVLENYDFATLLRNKDGSVRTTTSYRMADNSPAPVMQFVKKIDGNYYAVEAVTDAKAHHLGILSAYMANANGGGQVLGMGQTAPRSITSQTGLDRNSSTLNISQQGAAVNPDYSALEAQDTARLTADPAQAASQAEGNSETARPRIHSQFFAEPGMAEGDFPIDSARLNRMVQRANEVVDAALAERVLTRDEVQSTVAAMLAQDFRMAPGAADSLAARFADQYQAVIDQGSARLYQEAQTGDGRFRPSQANRTLQNAVQMTPEELDAAGMDVGGEQYMTRSEAFSNRQAQSIIEQNGWDGAYDYLMQNDRWNPADVKAAVAVSQHFLEQARSATDAATRSELYDKVGQLGMRYVQDRSAAGRALQASAEFARANPVMDAIGKVTQAIEESDIGKSMTPEDRAAAIREIAESAQQIETYLGEQNASGLIDIINQYAKRRGITKTVLSGQVREVNALIEKMLNGMDVDTLSAFANASIDGYITDTYSSPPNRGEKLKTIQVLSHLFNPRTWMRNVVGNAAFSSIDSTANGFATLLDLLIGKRTGTRSTVVGPNFFSSEAMSAKQRALAQSIAAVYLDVDLTGGTNRYGQANTRTFRMNSDSKLAFLTRFLSKLERNLNYALTSTDQFAKGGVQATQQARIQQMLDAGQIDPERLGVDVTPEEYAGWRGRELARYRTFQDNSRLAAGARSIHDTLNLAGVGDSGRTINGKTVKAFGLGDLLMPYPGVPGNIASRAIEYSPVGAARGLVDIGKVLKAGSKATVQAQSKAVLELSRGITGSALIGLAALMAAHGLIRSTDDDDNLDEKRLNKAEGIDGIQVNVSALIRMLGGKDTQWKRGDRLASLDFLQPVNAWLALGCFIDSYLSGDKDYDAFTASVDAFGRSIEDFPVLQTLQNIVDDVRYNDMGVAAAIMQESAGNIMSSLVPSLVRNIATATDEYQRDTTSGKYGMVSLYDWISQKTGFKNNILKALAEFMDDTLKVDQSVSTVFSAVPGLRQMLPIKLDNYGQPMGYTGNRALDVANAVFLPGAVYAYNQRDLTRALSSVSAYTGTSHFYPNRSPASYVEYQGQRHDLTAAEQQEYQKTYGATYYDLANDLIQSQEYLDADPMARADMFSQIEEIASAQARVEYMDSIGVDYSGSNSAKLIAKMDDYFSTGMTFGQYYDWKTRMAEFSGDTKQADILSALSGSGLSEAQQEAIYYNMGGYSISDEKQAEGTSVGLTEDDLKYWRYRIDQAQAAGTDDSQLLWQIYQSVDLSDEQKNMVAKLFLSDATVIPKETDVDFSSYDSFLLSQLPETAQTRYQVYAKDYLSPEEWSEIYNTFSGYRTKTQMQQAMLAAGLSQSDADILYSWISGSLDDSYYVGQMTETAQYVWSQALESADIMSAKQWLEYSGNYSGQDYDTILAELLNDGWAQATAQTLAQILSQM